MPLTSSDELTAKEYKRYCKAARAQNQYNVSDNYPLPDMGTDPMIERKDVRAIYEVQGIEDEYFAQLNGTRVYGWYWKGISGSPTNLVRRQRDKFEREQKDDSGRTVLERVPKPSQDSVGVLSDVNIELPYGYSAPEDSGFGYADSWTDSGKTEYAYYIPSKYLYEVNLTSLVVAPVSGQGGGYGTINVYQGQVFQTWEFGKVLIGITPYKKPLKALTDDSRDVTHRRNRIRIVGIKVGADWSQEYQSLLQYLLHEGFLPNYTKLQGIQDIDTVAEYQTMTESYTEVDYMSLADRKRLETGDFSEE